MSRERDPLWAKAVELRHGKCGWIVGAADAHRTELTGTGDRRTVRVVELRLEPEPTNVGAARFFRCSRCNEAVALTDTDVNRACAELERVMIWDPKLGVVTREDGRRVGALRVTLSG